MDLLAFLNGGPAQPLQGLVKLNCYQAVRGNERRFFLYYKWALFFQTRAAEYWLRITAVQVRSEDLRTEDLKLDSALERESMKHQGLVPLLDAPTGKWPEQFFLQTVDTRGGVSEANPVVLVTVGSRNKFRSTGTTRK